MQDFQSTFNEIRSLDPACAEYLLDIGLEHWARAHFPRNRYNIMTSNLAESWNAVLSEAREFPVIPLIGFICGKLTEWFAARREAANKNRGSITPKVAGIITKNFEKGGGYHVTMIAEDEYEVRNKKGVVSMLILLTRRVAAVSFRCCPFRVHTLSPLPLEAKLALTHWCRLLIQLENSGPLTRGVCSRF